MSFIIEYLPTKTGKETAKVNDFFIHSKYDPEKEALNFVEKEYEPGKSYVLFGYGLGYIHSHLMSKLEEGQKIVVIDPIFPDKFVLNEKSLFLKPAVFKTDKLIKFLGLVNDIKVLCSPNYDKICIKNYRDVLNEVKNYLRIRNVSNNTVKKQGLLWNMNYLDNLKFVSKDQTLVQMKGQLDYPVVIASGGPSLTKQLPLLKKSLDKCIVIAAGTTINSLLAAGIEPDFVISIDGNDANFENFKDLTLEHSIFVYDMHSHPKIRSVLKSKALYFLSSIIVKQKPQLEFIVDDEVAVLEGGGSVANFALTMARYISNGPITLIGQDLAYTNNKFYADNHKAQNTLTTGYTDGRELFLEKGYNGDQVQTDYAFLSMKKSFEKLIENLPLSSTIYNSTEGGIFIEGFTQIPFQQFVETHLTENIEKESLKKYLLKDDAKILANTQNLVLQLKKELESYQQLGYLLNDNLRLLKSNKLKDRYEANILLKLEKNDQKIEEIIQNNSIAISAQIVQLEVLTKFKEKQNENSYESYVRVDSQNKFLYKALLELVDIISKKTEEILISIH